VGVKPFKHRSKSWVPCGLRCIVKLIFALLKNGIACGKKRKTRGFCVTTGAQELSAKPPGERWTAKLGPQVTSGEVYIAY